MRTKRISFFLFLFCITFCFSQDVCPPSFSPPGGLSVNKVHLFVAFGFDDTQYADGMNWVIDFMDGKTNPVGIGNAATYNSNIVLPQNEGSEQWY